MTGIVLAISARADVFSGAPILLTVPDLPSYLTQMALTRSPTLPKKGKPPSGTSGTAPPENETNENSSYPSNVQATTATGSEIPQNQSGANVSAAPPPPHHDRKKNVRRGAAKEAGIFELKEGGKGEDFDNCHEISETSAQNDQSDGMENGVKRLDDNVFTLWGGRSRTPSIDEEENNKQYKCRGGPGKLNCGKIVDPSKNGEAGIKCDYCSDWYHAACQMVPKAAVTAVGKFSMIHWFCGNCRATLFGKPEEAPVEKLKDRLDALENNSLKKMSEQIESMAGTVKDHVRLVDRVLSSQEQVANRQENLLTRSLKELHDQKMSYADMLKGSCSKVVKDVSEQFTNIKNQAEQVTTPARVIASTVDSAMDKERRKLNVVISNLAENEPTETESREKQDLQKFVDFVKDALHVQLRAIRCFRVGKIQESRPRLLVVTLEDLSAKIELLRMSSQLRHIPDWSHVYINPDFTPAEREERRKLRQELLSRREAGETNLVIRKGKIVKINSSNEDKDTRGPGHIKHGENASAATVNTGREEAEGSKKQ